MINILFVLTLIFNFVSSVLIGRIKYASIITNTTFLSTSSSQCLDCLCNCLTNSKNITCYGINCFPSNYSCQFIEQLWIQEIDLSFNSTSDQFITTINLNFCSCYTSQNILNAYQNTTGISTSNSNSRFIKYNSYDNTLIVLGDNQINQYFVSNLTLFRTKSVTSIPLNVFIDSIHIYISFYNNASVNQYDMNMNFIKCIPRPITSSNAGLYGLTEWKNQLFISDQQLNLIWSINLTTMNMSIYLNMSVYNILVFNIAVFNDLIYVSQFSSSAIYIINLISFVTTIVTFPNSIPLYRMQMDPYCNRIWFGVNNQNYSLVPILDLNTNKAQLYQANGSLANTKVNLVEFDSTYSMYTVETGVNYFYKYKMPNINCGKL